MASELPGASCFAATSQISSSDVSWVNFTFKEDVTREVNTLKHFLTGPGEAGAVQ